jgi:CheY-like chemotaxis protein
MNPSAPSKKRVLVIDDDPALRRLLSFGLQRAGYETLTAQHGGEAMTIVGSVPLDLLLIDLMMPVIDGFRFLRWLREEAGLAVPALVFTSYEQKDLADEARSRGATDVIRKPLKLPDLLDRVGRLLGQSA